MLNVAIVVALFAALGGAPKPSPPPPAPVPVKAAAPAPRAKATKAKASPPVDVHAQVIAAVAAADRESALRTVVSTVGGPWVHERVWCEVRLTFNPDAATMAWLVDHRPPIHGEDPDSERSFCATITDRRAATGSR